jgi:hypothetical protein
MGLVRDAPLKAELNNVRLRYARSFVTNRRAILTLTPGRHSSYRASVNWTEYLIILTKTILWSLSCVDSAGHTGGHQGTGTSGKSSTHTVRFDRYLLAYERT